MVFKSSINWKDEIEFIRERGKEGWTYKQLGDHYGVTRERIRQIIRQYIPEWKGKLGRAARAEKKVREYRKKFGAKKETDPDLYQAQRTKFSNKKANAKRNGWTWNLDFGDLNWPTHCPILGIELDYYAEGRQENSPSFDQIDAGKGYVPGNVQVISWRANRIKNDGTAEEHRRIADYLDSL